MSADTEKSITINHWEIRTGLRKERNTEGENRENKRRFCCNAGRRTVMMVWSLTGRYHPRGADDPHGGTKEMRSGGGGDSRTRGPHQWWWYRARGAVNIVQVTTELHKLPCTITCNGYSRSSMWDWSRVLLDVYCWFKKCGLGFTHVVCMGMLDVSQGMAVSCIFSCFVFHLARPFCVCVRMRVQQGSTGMFSHAISRVTHPVSMHKYTLKNSSILVVIALRRWCTYGSNIFP